MRGEAVSLSPGTISLHLVQRVVYLVQGNGAAEDSTVDSAPVIARLPSPDSSEIDPLLKPVDRGGDRPPFLAQVQAHTPPAA